MGDILRERFCLKGHECGECGGWVSESNPTPCGGDLCNPPGPEFKGALTPRLTPGLLKDIALAEEMFDIWELEEKAREIREMGND